MLHQVGVGALGPVFRTYEPTRDRLVAVKVFRLDITPEQAQSLSDELSVAAEAGLFHPSVVEPIASGVEGTSAYRAEEYVAAESLDIAVRHYAPTTVDKVLPFITQMAGAIDFARTAGVGHGALHPRDVFVTPEEARITGFGVVEALQRVGIRAPVRRPYSAPERVAGQPWSTPADVFSLAAISYELLTGHRPSGLGTDIGAEGLTAPVHAALARAMDEDPEARYPTALAFASALEAAGRGESPSVAPAARPGKKSRGAAAASVAGAAAATPGPPDPEAAVEQIPPREDLDARRDPVAAEQEEDEFRQQEPEFDDIAAEREDDEAHLSLLREEADVPAEESEAPSLFDSEHESVEDLAIDELARAETDRFADEFMVAAQEESTATPDEPPVQASAIDSLREEVRARKARADAERIAEPAPEPATYGAINVPLGSYSPAPAMTHDRSRVPMLAIAVTLVLALLVGFLAGRAVGLREGQRPPQGSVDAGDTSPGAGQPGEASPGAKPRDEIVTPPVSAEPPPAVGEGVPAGEPGRPETAPVATPTPAPARPTTGRIIVRSTPNRAAVTVDGRWRGRTPMTIDELSFGRHEVRVVEDGYSVSREQVTLSEVAPERTLSFRLRRAPAAAPSRGSARTSKPATPAAPQSFIGTIYVDSRPRGARVLLDGKMVGVTPIRIPDVSVGSHVVRLQLEDHRDWTSSARVTSGQEARVTGSLERIR